MTKIALFGTSADPPTIGHQAIIDWLADAFTKVVVWAANNPFKTHAAALEDRQQMLALLIDDLRYSDRQVGLYPELSDSKTLISVRRAKQLWPQASLTLVLGADVISTLPHWYCAEALFEQVELLVLKRPEVSLSASAVAILQEQTQFEIADFEGPPVSSSHYRQTGDGGELTPAIATYIRQHHLYVWKQATSTSRAAIASSQP
ncbi:MAG: nicotinate-nucleotide adenylyltransferase [Acaryochloridaceae cyanobacterium SU_2_1]|nr:nicotinate-nucleotide adenylyltransferase [Acaryochloridaceae cyanobacterium SU_2_1]